MRMEGKITFSKIGGKNYFALRSSEQSEERRRAVGMQTNPGTLITGSALRSLSEVGLR